MMGSMDTTQGAALERVIGLARNDPAVLAVILFGSQARSEAASSSDVDVCLVLEPGVPVDLSASRKRLDYLTEADLELVIFQQLPLVVRSRVLREGQVLFVKETDRLYELAIRTARAFERFRHHHRRYLDAVGRD
jgi:predicted nucleotidyltransferase